MSRENLVAQPDAAASKQRGPVPKVESTIQGVVKDTTLFVKDTTLFTNGTTPEVMAST
jgi:hypothetical protein